MKPGTECQPCSHRWQMSKAWCLSRCTHVTKATGVISVCFKSSVMGCVASDAGIGDIGRLDETHGWVVEENRRSVMWGSQGSGYSKIGTPPHSYPDVVGTRGLKIAFSRVVTARRTALTRSVPKHTTRFPRESTRCRQRRKPGTKPPPLLSTGAIVCRQHTTSA